MYIPKVLEVVCYFFNQLLYIAPILATFVMEIEMDVTQFVIIEHFDLVSLVSEGNGCFGQLDYLLLVCLSQHHLGSGGVDQIDQYMVSIAANLFLEM